MPARPGDGTVTGIDMNVDQVAVSDGHRAWITAKQVAETGIRSILLVSCSLGGRNQGKAGRCLMANIHPVIVRQEKYNIC